MLKNYKEIMEQYGTDYMLKKAISNKEVFFIEKGIYSDEADNFTIYELLLKKYDKAFLVKDSALNHLNFTKEEPKVIHLGTARNALRIKDERVKQHFYSNYFEKKRDFVDNPLYFGNIHHYITANKNEIRFWNLNALLFDLIRDSKQYSQNKLMDILYKFRDCSRFDEFDFSSFEDALFCYNVPCDEKTYRVLKEIEYFALDRRMRRDDLEDFGLD